MKRVQYSLSKQWTDITGYAQLATGLPVHHWKTYRNLGQEQTA